MSPVSLSSVWPVWPGGQVPKRTWFSTITHGTYDTTYSATGITRSPTISQSTGRPQPAPRRSQPTGGSLGGSTSNAGSSGDGATASGPNPNRPRRTNSEYSAAAARNARKPSSIGVAATGPSVSGFAALPLLRP